MAMWTAVGAEVVAESGAKLATYEKAGTVITGFSTQLRAVPLAAISLALWE